MLKRWKNIILVALLQYLGICNLLIANPDYIPIEKFHLSDGLSQIQVTDIFLHSSGYLWIGTQDGLNRYDGYTFKIFRNQPFDSLSLVSNYVLDMDEDADGNLWIATNQGLSRYNPNTGLFQNFEHDPDDETSISGNIVYSVLIDNNGTIWAQTISTLEKFNPQSNTFTHFYPENNPENFLVGKEYFSLFEDSKSNLWMITKDGLHLFNRNDEAFSQVFSSASSSDDIRLKGIQEDDKGRLWIGTSEGLYEYQSDIDLLKAIKQDDPSAQYSINTIGQLPNGNLWLGTTKGIKNYNIQTETFTEVTGIIENTSYFNPKTVSTFLLDSSEILWIGGIDGLMKYDTRGPLFKLYQKSPVSPYQLSSNLIASIYEDQYGLLWIGTWGSGLNILNRETGKTIHYSNDGNNPKLHISQNNVHVIKEDSKGNIWLGTNNGLNIKYATETGFVRLCEKYPHVPCNIFGNNRIYSIHENKTGHYLVGTKNGLHIFNSNNKEVRSIYDIKFNGRSIPLKTVYSICELTDSTIWLGTDNGIFVLKQPANACISYLHNTKSLKGELSNNSVYTIFEDSRGMIWVGTASGLNKYNKSTGEFKVYSEKDGLPNNLIYNIVEDDAGYLWMSTNMGLSKFNPGNETFLNYEITDGLQNQEFNLGAAYKSPSGELFFGGISGFNSFFPTSLHKNYYIPPIVINSVNAINGHGAYEIKLFNNELIIPADVSLFNIDFAALDFTHPGKNRFEYSLTQPGQEPKWINIDTKHAATFSNLPQGNYIFTVRGSNSDRVWNTDGTSILITVMAPYWKTNFAYAMYFFIGLFLILLIIYGRSRTMNRMKRLLRIQEKTSELLEQQKELLTRKNKNITDSINYAKRIQEAMMPSEILFERYLPKSFILHQPKDIVSGDFFWIYKSNQKVFVAAVDCTGHGVPGAFMSIIGFELFRKITHTEGIQEPANILNELNEDFAEIFGDVENVTLRDGMDIALCVIDTEKSVLEFAGAFNPLYLVREDRIIEIKGDRYSIGLDEHKEDQIFNTHRFNITPADMIYIFTDGYADQFGGPEGKKFKYRRFRHLLLAIHKMQMDQQKNILIDTFKNWSKGFEQVDDIMVIGIKPDFSE